MTKAAKVMMSLPYDVTGSHCYATHATKACNKHHKNETMPISSILNPYCRTSSVRMHEMFAKSSWPSLHAHTKVTKMGVISLKMVRSSIRNHCWKALEVYNAVYNTGGLPMTDCVK